MVPYRMGRTDSSAASAEGFLPKAEGTTDSHKEIFARMGFSPTEAITLVACGHTLGGVHSSVHPELTSEAHASFDGTLANFDNEIAKQHLNKSVLAPLNEPWDPSAPGRSSDARLFNSDNNATISRLATSNEAFISACGEVFAKMFDTAVPSSVSLSGPIEPFPISGTLRLSLRNGVYSTSLAAFRIYDMVGRWSNLEVTLTNRDGSVGDQSIMTMRALRTQSIGKTIEIQDFAINNIPPATGLGSFVAKLTMSDGSVFTATEGEHIIPIDDTVIIDVGAAYTCKYSGEPNNNAAGLNVTMVVLGPYNPADQVSVIVRTNSGNKFNIKATYRRERDAYYNFYNAFIPDMDAIDLMTFGAQVIKADGSVHRDTRDGRQRGQASGLVLTESDVYYPTSTLSNCIAGAEVPPSSPTPSGALTRRHAPVDPRKRIAHADVSCPSGYTVCNERCINPFTDIEHCGGCSGSGGVDCTAIEGAEDVIACIAGRCVRGDE